MATRSRIVFMDMNEDQARKYVVENTKWSISEEDGNYFLIGDNHISGFGFSENEIGRPWVNELREAVENGDIIYVEYTGQEFLRYRLPEGGCGYSYLGDRGRLEDWKDQQGVSKEDGEYPDSLGGIIEGTLYVQSNKDVDNPLNEHEGWENEWLIFAPNKFQYKLSD